MRTIYFDCFSGISGDMVLGALVDLGVPLREVTKSLKALPLRGYRIESEKTLRGGIRGTRVTISVKKELQKDRTYSMIARMIRRSSLPRRVKDMSLAIFNELAKAESRVHAVPLMRVEFHEVGGVDSIADIVGSCVGLDILGVQTIRASPIPWSRGWVNSRAGLLPLPAPATAELMKGIPIVPGNTGKSGKEDLKEMVTPTGIAILKGTAEGFGEIPAMSVEGIGYGAGSYNHERPNLLRCVLGKKEHGEDTTLVLETNIDDMNPQLYEPLMEALFNEGALDVYLTPVQMKKGRPGILLTVLAREADRDRIARVIFSQSTTIGLRWFRVGRYTLERKRVMVRLKKGSIGMKISRGPSGYIISPEYRDIRRLAQRTGRSVKDIYHEVLTSLNAKNISRLAGSCYDKDV